MLLARADSRIPRTSEDHDHEERGNIEAEMPSGIVEIVARKVLQPGRQIRGRNPHERRMNAEPIEQIDNMSGKPHAHAHIAERILQYQIPADDPRHQLAERRVRVRVRGAGNGDHGCEFCVAQPGKGAHNRHQHQAQCQRRSRARPPVHRGVVQQVVNQRSIVEIRLRKRLPGHRRADNRKYPRPDHRANPQRGQRPRPKRFLQRVFRLLRVPDELVD